MPYAGVSRTKADIAQARSNASALLLKHESTPYDKFLYGELRPTNIEFRKEMEAKKKKREKKERKLMKKNGGIPVDLKDSDDEYYEREWNLEPSKAQKEADAVRKAVKEEGDGKRTAPLRTYEGRLQSDNPIISKIADLEIKRREKKDLKKEIEQFHAGLLRPLERIQKTDITPSRLHMDEILAAGAMMEYEAYPDNTRIHLAQGITEIPPDARGIIFTSQRELARRRVEEERKKWEAEQKKRKKKEEAAARAAAINRRLPKALQFGPTTVPASSSASSIKSKASSSASSIKSASIKSASTSGRRPSETPSTESAGSDTHTVREGGEGSDDEGTEGGHGDEQEAGAEEAEVEETPKFELPEEFRRSVLAKRYRTEERFDTFGFPTMRLPIQSRPDQFVDPMRRWQQRKKAMTGSAKIEYYKEALAAAPPPPTPPPEEPSGSASGSSKASWQLPLLSRRKKEKQRQLDPEQDGEDDAKIIKEKELDLESPPVLDKSFGDEGKGKGKEKASNGAGPMSASAARKEPRPTSASTDASNDSNSTIPGGAGARSRNSSRPGSSSSTATSAASGSGRNITSPGASVLTFATDEFGKPPSYVSRVGSEGRPSPQIPFAALGPTDEHTIDDAGAAGRDDNIVADESIAVGIPSQPPLSFNGTGSLLDALPSGAFLLPTDLPAEPPTEGSMSRRGSAANGKPEPSAPDLSEFVGGPVGRTWNHADDPTAMDDDDPLRIAIAASRLPEYSADAVDSTAGSVVDDASEIGDVDAVDDGQYSQQRDDDYDERSTQRDDDDYQDDRDQEGEPSGQRGGYDDEDPRDNRGGGSGRRQPAKDDDYDSETSEDRRRREKRERRILRELRMRELERELREEFTQPVRTALDPRPAPLPPRPITAASFRPGGYQAGRIALQVQETAQYYSHKYHHGLPPRVKSPNEPPEVAEAYHRASVIAKNVADGKIMTPEKEAKLKKKDADLLHGKVKKDPKTDTASVYLKTMTYGLRRDLRARVERKTPVSPGFIPHGNLKMAQEAIRTFTPRIGVEIAAKSFDRQDRPVIAGRAALVRGIIRVPNLKDHHIVVRTVGYTSSYAPQNGALDLEPQKSKYTHGERMIFELIDVFDVNGYDVLPKPPPRNPETGKLDRTWRPSNEEEDYFIQIPFDINWPVAIASRNEGERGVQLATAVPPSFEAYPELFEDEPRLPPVPIARRGNQAADQIPEPETPESSLGTRALKKVKNALSSTPRIRDVHRAGVWYYMIFEWREGKPPHEGKVGRFACRGDKQVNCIKVPINFLGEESDFPFGAGLFPPRLPPSVILKPGGNFGDGAPLVGNTLGPGWAVYTGKVRWAKANYPIHKRELKFDFHIPEPALFAVPSLVPFILIVRPTEKDQLPSLDDQDVQDVLRSGSAFELLSSGRSIRNSGDIKRSLSSSTIRGMEDDEEETAALINAKAAAILERYDNPLNAAKGVSGWFRDAFGIPSNYKETLKGKGKAKADDAISVRGEKSASANGKSSSSASDRKDGEKTRLSSDSRAKQDAAEDDDGDSDDSSRNSMEKKSMEKTSLDAGKGWRPGTGLSRFSSRTGATTTSQAASVAPSVMTIATVQDICSYIQVCLQQQIHSDDNNVNGTPNIKKRIVGHADMEEVDLESLFIKNWDVNPANHPPIMDHYEVEAIRKAKRKGYRVIQGVIPIPPDTTPSFKCHGVALKYSIKVDFMSFSKVLRKTVKQIARSNANLPRSGSFSSLAGSSSAVSVDPTVESQPGSASVDLSRSLFGLKSRAEIWGRTEMMNRFGAKEEQPIPEDPLPELPELNPSLSIDNKGWVNYVREASRVRAAQRRKLLATPDSSHHIPPTAVSDITSAWSTFTLDPHKMVKDFGLNETWGHLWLDVTLERNHISRTAVGMEL